jgi:hypothetical protein
MITHVDWQVRNSQRRYPIDDNASATSDSGVALPESFLVDACIWVPQEAGINYVYVSSMSVTPQLVSITFLGCVDYMGSPSSFVPLASLSLVKPVVSYKNYAIEPLLDGVMGWAAFGHLANAADVTLSLMFSQPSQSLLTPKAARFYGNLPVASASAYDGFSTASGDVRILANQPVVAEIKDMRLYGETTDRKMLVLSLLQTENVLSQFAGLCGKRPETGNCLKTPITSIAGVGPDCTGNVQISFDSEIIVRYFTNPEYPTDPLPVRGGLCLDSVYDLDSACAKNRTIADDAGLLPNELVWKRPCDLTLPFSTSFGSMDDLKEVVLLAGYAYLDEYSVVVTAGVQQSAELAPCFPTLTLTDSVSTRRSHKVTFSEVPRSSEVGMFVLDTVNTRVLLRVTRAVLDNPESGLWSLSRFNKGLNAPESTLAAGIWGESDISSVSVTVTSDREIIVKVNGETLVSATLDEGDVYFDADGKAGVYVGGVVKFDYTPKPAVTISNYQVAEGDL